MVAFFLLESDILFLLFLSSLLLLFASSPKLPHLRPPILTSVPPRRRWPYHTPTVHLFISFPPKSIQQPTQISFRNIHRSVQTSTSSSPNLGNHRQNHFSFSIAHKTIASSSKPHNHFSEPALSFPFFLSSNYHQNPLHISLAAGLCSPRYHLLPPAAPRCHQLRSTPATLPPIFSALLHGSSLSRVTSWSPPAERRHFTYRSDATASFSELSPPAAPSTTEPSPALLPSASSSRSTPLPVILTAGFVSSARPATTVSGAPSSSASPADLGPPRLLASPQPAIRSSSQGSSITSSTAAHLRLFLTSISEQQHHNRSQPDLFLSNQAVLPPQPSSPAEQPKAPSSAAAASSTANWAAFLTLKLQFSPSPITVFLDACIEVFELVMNGLNCYEMRILFEDFVND